MVNLIKLIYNYNIIMSEYEKEYGYTPSDFEKIFQTCEFISENVSDDFSHIEKTILTFLINGDHYLATEYLHKATCISCHCPRKIARDIMDAKYIFEKPTRFWSCIEQNPYHFNYGNIDHYSKEFFSGFLTEHLEHIIQIVKYIDNKDADMDNADIKNLISEEYKNVCDSIKVLSNCKYPFSQVLSKCKNELFCDLFTKKENNILIKPYYETILKDIIMMKMNY